MNNIYINIKDVAEAKGLKSTRSIRLELNRPESKYISREVTVNGGTSYEILFSSLEPELQDKLRKNEKKSTALVPLNYKPPQFVSDNAKITANFRTNIVLALIKYRKNYSTKKQAVSEFLDLYNTGLYLPKAYKFIGSISLGTIAQIKALDLLLNNHMGPLNEEQRELLLLTRDSCNFMYEMLSTLLSTYKYENGDYALNYERCNIISLIEETINELESMQKEKNVTIYINKEGNIFNTDCDKMQIKRVLTNILGNAISYAYNDTPIHISIKQNENSIGVETKNKSSYINSETMSNLFKKYVSHAAKFNKVGVGLGLYLSKQIIDTHNGDIYAKSFEDNHNIFGFVLPLVDGINNRIALSN